jgi:uncharacterized protein YunC (DUF1805 family)
MATPPRRKTSFEVDFAKVDAARRVLGTKTLTDTVDAALDEVVKRQQRKVLVEMLSSGVLELNNPEVMAGAWR